MCALTLKISIEVQFPPLWSTLLSIYLRIKGTYTFKIQSYENNMWVELLVSISAELLIQCTFKGAQSLDLGTNWYLIASILVLTSLCLAFPNLKILTVPLLFSNAENINFYTFTYVFKVWLLMSGTELSSGNMMAEI